MKIEVLRPGNLASSSISAGFFCRTGGVSRGVYESLNCGPGSDDNPEAVKENRSRALKALTGNGGILCTLYQVHSNNVLVVNKPFTDRPKADAMVTKTPGLALGILTADCVPVFLADEKAGIIGAAHAGWRGALAGILEETVSAMVALGAHPGAIRAAIGPCISVASYEVGEEFKMAFMAKDTSYDRFFAPGDEGKSRFSLNAFVESRLEAAGVEDIWKLSLDTYALESRFFSYRRSAHRNETDYGRQLSAVCFNP